ncbi:hypothetical protein E4T47_08420 [Aureobasidium subglaciale]|nr:hypothetical protein E4T47_08420 [Aureobasidium subglaciale]
MAPTLDKVLLHGYCWGNAFWYGSRGLCRVVDPLMVIGWFRPPVEQHLSPTDLELYNVRTDGWGLISLAAALLVLSRAYSLGHVNRSYSKAVVLVSVFHHVTTMMGAYQHYKLDSHYTAAMWIGVWVNLFLTVVGAIVAASTVLSWPAWKAESAWTASVTCLIDLGQGVGQQSEDEPDTDESDSCNTPVSASHVELVSESEPDLEPELKPIPPDNSEFKRETPSNPKQRKSKKSKRSTKFLKLVKFLRTIKSMKSRIMNSKKRKRSRKANFKKSNPT